ncbi:retrotransposon protein, putative, ty1-copia subclass [Tanacetum coccineum]
MGDAKDVISPAVTDEPIVKEKQSTSVDTSIPIVENTCLRSITVVVPVESIRAGKYGLVKSMFTSSTGLLSFHFSSMDGLNAMLETGPWFIRNHTLILKKINPNVNLLKEDVGIVLGRSSYTRAMIELQANVELKDTILVAMPKLSRQGFYRCNIRVEYVWKPPRCACCKVFGHIREECPRNPGLGVVKNLKKPSHASRGVQVSLKVSFKPAKEYRPILKKPTANTSGNKKKGVEPTKEGSNSNPFDGLNSVDNDEELGTNEGTLNLASNGIGKIEKQIMDVKLTLVDNDGKPLKKVYYPGDHDGEDEVESVDNDMARSMASEWVGFGTKCLLEQWRDSYEIDDYDEDPYDDDMNEGQDLPDKIQDICDNLDI